MSDTLYLQLDTNIQVQHPHIYLQDIAKLACSNAKVLNRLRVLPVASLDHMKSGQYVMSAMDLIDMIQKKEPDLSISHIGEPDFILTYRKSSASGTVFRWFKIFFLCRLLEVCNILCLFHSSTRRKQPSKTFSVWMAAICTTQTDL